MKKLTLSLAVLLLGTVLIHAQDGTEGDIILGFQQTTSTATGYGTNEEFDLGSAATLVADAGTGKVVDLSADFSLADVTGEYGTTAANLTTLYFGLAGTPGIQGPSSAEPGYTVFVGSGSSTDPNRETTQTNLENSVDNLYNTYASDENGDGSATVPVGNTGSGSYTDVAGSDGTFHGAFSYTTQDIFSNSGSQTLALYEVEPGATTKGTELGTITLNDSTGSLVFTATTAPEPSTYALMGLGLGIFAFVMRRRLATNA